MQVCPIRNRTTTTVPHQAGDTRIEVVDTQGFRIGEEVEIVEMQHLRSFRAMIVAFGSIIIDQRLP